MNAIYFPFTYISEQAAKTFAAIFEKLTVYLPSANAVPGNMEILSTNGIIDIRTPIEKDEDKLMAVYKEFIEWGNIHQQNTISSLKHRTENPFLFDDSWPAQLKTDIQKISQGKSSQQTDADLAARIFLQIAQEYDRHQTEIVQDVQSIDNMEKSLFKDLRANDFQGIRETAESLSSGLQDLGIYMTKERLSSWYELLKHDHTLPSNVFITNSPGVWEYLLEYSPEAEIMGENIPVVFTESMADTPLKKLSASLSLLQKEKWSASDLKIYPEKQIDMDKTSGVLTLRIVPDTPPEAYLSRFAQQATDTAGARHSNFQNTIIGVLQQTIQ